LDNIIALNINRDLQSSFLQKIDELSNQSSPSKIRKSQHSPKIGDGLKILGLNGSRKSVDMKDENSVIQPRIGGARKTKGSSTVKID